MEKKSFIPKFRRHWFLKDGSEIKVVFLKTVWSKCACISGVADLYIMINRTIRLINYELIDCLID